MCQQQKLTGYQSPRETRNQYLYSIMQKLTNGTRCKRRHFFYFFSSNPSDIRLQSHADLVPLLFDRTSPHFRVIDLHSSRVNLSVNCLLPHSTVFSRTYYEVSTDSPFVLQSTVAFTLELIQFFNSLLEYHPLQTRELLFLSLAALD